MTSTTHRPESTAAALDVGCERRTKEWRLTRSTAADARRQRARVGPGDREAVPRVLAAAKARAGVAADAPGRRCSDAGRDGLWPQRFLTAVGVTNLVVDSSSLEVPRRARRAKTDRLDGEKLRRLLRRHWGGEREMWHVVHVPSREGEDARPASRGLTTVPAARTR
jgi:transposase